MPRKTPKDRRTKTASGVISITHFLNKRVKKWADMGRFPIYYNINRQGVPYSYRSRYWDVILPQQYETEDVQTFITIESGIVLEIVARYAKDEIRGEAESFIRKREFINSYPTPPHKILNAYLTYFQRSATGHLKNELRPIIEGYLSAAIDKRFGAGTARIFLNQDGTKEPPAATFQIGDQGQYRVLRKEGTIREKRLFVLYLILKKIDEQHPKYRFNYPFTINEAQRITAEEIESVLRKFAPSTLSMLSELVGDLTHEMIEKRLIPLLRNVTNG